MKYHMKHLTPKDTGCLRSTNRIIAQTESDVNFRIFVNFSLLRYVYCDWGDLPPSGFALNDSALKLGTDQRCRTLHCKRQWDIMDWQRWPEC